MSGREFQSLYYTHCGPGQGLRDAAGLQFQAVSPGTTDEMKSLVERSALYQAPPDGSAADRTPSLVHVHDGVYATARGIPLDGGEDQFTHALATTDARAYGPIRPAQLWNAPWWVEQAAASTECEGVSAEPETGPLGVEALREWVLGQENGESRLTAVHSALDRVQDKDAPRLLFVSEDAETAVRWIAVGTLLLPQERALQVGFRVFAGDPRSGESQVLAVRPDQAGSQPDGEFTVFNLVTGEDDETEPTAAARHWVPRFLADDPYNVVDAIELAHQFARNRSEARPTEADHLAAAVLMLDEPVTAEESAMALAEWLVSPPPVSTTDVVEPVLEAVLAAAPGHAVLLKLAETTTDRAGRARIELLRAEIDEIVRGTPGDVRGTLPPHAWGAGEAEEATALIESAAAAIAPDRMDLLLRTAARFDVRPRVDRFPEAAQRFVEWWAEHPHAGVDPSRWTCGPELVGLLRDELGERLAGPDENRTIEAVNERWWRLLVPTIGDPFLPLDAAVAAAAVAADGSARQETIARFRERLRASEQPGIGEAVWEALFKNSPPTLAELKDFVTTLPLTALTDAVAQRAFVVLENAKVSGRYLDILRVLSHHIRDREQLHKLWEDDSRLRTWLSTFARKGTETGAVTLDGISDKVFTARADEITTVLLDVALPDAVTAIAQGSEQLQQMLVYELPASWNNDQVPLARRDHAVALAFLTGWQDTASEQVRSAFDKALECWAGEHQQSDYRRISKLLRGVEAEYAAAWHEWIREYSQQQPKRSRSKELAKRLFGKREK